MYNRTLTTLEKSADVVSLAFANDPLIRWLRPASIGQVGKSEVTSLRPWQTRRLQRFQLYGRVVILPDGSESSIKEALSTSPAENSMFPDIAAVALIEAIDRPSIRRRSLRWWLNWLQYQWSETVSPVEDQDADIQRVDIMLEAHSETMETLRQQHDLSNSYYLEVAAVHPDKQGQGVGRRLMEMVLASVGDATVVLECTTRSNVNFYQKFGFRLLRECNLSIAKGDTVAIWVMIREVT